ncbi:TPA: hypothetical protein ACS9RQ_005299 [Klebsiella pneumoniae]
MPQTDTANVIPELAGGWNDGLACFIFRFLKRPHEALFHARLTTEEIGGYLMKKSGRWLNDAPDIQLVYAIPQDVYD